MLSCWLLLTYYKASWLFQNLCNIPMCSHFVIKLKSNLNTDEAITDFFSGHIKDSRFSVMILHYYDYHFFLQFILEILSTHTHTHVSFLMHLLCNFACTVISTCCLQENFPSLIASFALSLCLLLSCLGASSKFCLLFSTPICLLHCLSQGQSILQEQCVPGNGREKRGKRL